MDRLQEEFRYNPVHMMFGYLYYEATIYLETGTWNQDCEYQIEVGCSHREDPNCGKYVCE